MPIEEELPQNTLRETLEANIEAAEAGTLPSPEEIKTQPRDEVGRFAQKQKEEEKEKPPPEAPVEQKPVEQPKWTGPSTWRKDYRPLWEKLSQAQPLAPEEAKKFLEYINQRENEYKTGVSTYRTEAEKAKELHEAITPFLPELQSNGINPAQWIKNMGQAHYALAKGTPQLKLQVVQEICRQYGVPIGALMQQGPVPQFVTDLMAQQQAYAQQINELRNWKQQTEQERQAQVLAALTSEVEKFQDETKYPHFEAARETMAQLLERGVAPDLEQAYEQAKWLVPEIREQLVAQKTLPANKAQAVAQAKARAVSPKSSTPSGQVGTAGPKDRRALLNEQFESLGEGRL